MTPPIPPTPAWTERWLALPQGKLVLREAAPAAAGPAVWLMHGISSGAASWSGLAAALPGQRLLAWDAPGYGDSQPLAVPEPSAQDYAEVAAQAIAALGLGPVLLVGHSLGALVAAALAAKLGPQRCTGVLLLSPAQGYGAKPEQAAKVRVQRLQALAELGVAGLAERISARLLSAQASPEHHAQVQAVARRMTPGGYTQAVHLLCSSDLPTLAALSGLPCLPDLPGQSANPTPQQRVQNWQIACGSADVVTPPLACAALADALGLRFTLLPGAGHACPVEQPQAVAGLVRAMAAAATEPAR